MRLTPRIFFPTLVFVFIFISRVSALAQPAPAAQSGTASIDTKEAKSAGGASSWLTYTLTWSLVKSGRGDGPDGENVTLTCENLSCGMTCAKKHEGALRGYFTLLAPNMRQAEKDAAAAALHSGGTPYPADWLAAAAAPLRAAAAWAEAQKGSIALQHWAPPCTISRKIFGFDVYDFDVRGTFVRHTRRGGKVIDKPGGSHFDTLARIWIPDPAEPVEVMETKTCSCAQGAGKQ